MTDKTKDLPGQSLGETAVELLNAAVGGEGYPDTVEDTPKNHARFLSVSKQVAEAMAKGYTVDIPNLPRRLVEKRLSTVRRGQSIYDVLRRAPRGDQNLMISPVGRGGSCPRPFGPYDRLLAVVFSFTGPRRSPPP